MNYNKLLESNNVDAIWVTETSNKRYISGFTGSTSEVIITKDETIFITDGRYKTQIKSELKPGITVKMATTSISYFEAIVEVLEKFKKIGFEANNVNYSQFLKLKNALNENVDLVGLDGVFEKIRITKTEEEIDLIKQAVKITDETFDYVVNNIKPGMSEVEVKLMLENKQMLLGASGASFDSIVASGLNSAKPHANASLKLVEEGDIITLDFGCFYNGYCSDMTRTFFVGKPNNDKLIEIHNLVNEAAKAQIAAIKAGKLCNEIDKIGRDIISNAGYGEYFMHGTGHGIGLEIHEDPYVAIKSDTMLEENMVITIEPGIYIEGIGGVRIEQDVVVRKEFGEVLNNSNTSYDVYNNRR